MSISMRQVAIKMDEVVPATSLSDLFAMHLAPIGWRDIWERHCHPHQKELRFMFLNTLLLEGGGEWIDRYPATHARARGIGRLIRDRYNIAALVEVFKDDEKDKILNQWQSRPSFKWLGRGKLTNFGKSGLLTISQPNPFRNSKNYTFEEKKKADRFAKKGILLCSIDIGLKPSLLDVYSTHLQAGKNHVKYQQLIELGSFLMEEQNLKNPSILCGDFNLGANSPDIVPIDKLLKEKKVKESPFFRLLSNLKSPIRKYEFLSLIMKELGFVDLWASRNGTPGYTGHISSKDVAEKICLPSSKNELFKDKEGDFIVHYCDDSKIPPTPYYYKKDKKSDRIDYIFFRKAQTTESFHLDFTRPRRLRLFRPNKDIKWLSDHVGLETTLLIAPK